MQWTVSLTPRHAGAIDIPALSVGSEKTPPLHVDVGSATAAGTSASAPLPQASALKDQSDRVFIENSIAPDRPYVQQATIYTIRLYFAVTLLDAALNAPSPDQGDLRQIGQDQRGSVVVQGRRYETLERHYLLQPEHSGVLHVPAPVFQGRTIPDLGAGFDDVTDTDLRAAGKPIDVQVRPRPANAVDPWLPARSLELTVDRPDGSLHSGEPLSLVVHLSGDGVTASQLPEINLPSMPGVHIYPEPSSTDNHERDGSVQAERTRRFAIVADHAGPLRLPDMTVPWWDVVNDRPAAARLAFPVLDLTEGVGSSGSRSAPQPTSLAASPATASARDGAITTNSASLRIWQLAAAALAALLALALAWGWRRGQRAGAAMPTDKDEPCGPARSKQTLARALTLGETNAIVKALREAAPGSMPDNLGEVARRLDDPAQREAVLAFEAGRWSADGLSLTDQIARLREAFSRPPRWAVPASSKAHSGALPPLYPD
jgi:hypothetical protein